MNDTPTRLPRPAASGSRVIRFACPACGEACTAQAEAAGRKARCSSCEAPLVIPPRSVRKRNPTKTKATKTTPKKTSSPARPSTPLATAERLTITCRHCATRYDVSARRRGQTVRCPDCGVGNEVKPSAETPRAPTRPAAIDEEPYELYEGDDQPWGTDLIASQPKLLPVVCQKCGTLMYATQQQISTTIVCPDCGAKAKVRQPEADPVRPKPMIEIVDHGTHSDPHDTATPYDIEEAVKNTLTRIAPEEYLKTPPLGLRREASGEGPASRRVRRPPRGVLFREALGCWRSPGLVACGIALSLVLSLSHLAPAAANGGVSMGVVSLSAGVIATVLLGVVMIATWGVIAAVLSILGMELISEASVGGDRPRQWPNFDPGDWFAPLLYTATAIVTAAAPGLAVAPLAPDEALWIVSGAVWLVLPVVLLSQLELSSPWGVLSPSVLSTFRQSPSPWLSFYVVSLPLTVGVAALYDYLTRVSWNLVLIDLTFMSAIVFASLTYARLCGLLAWVLEDAARERTRLEER